MTCEKTFEQDTQSMLGNIKEQIESTTLCPLDNERNKLLEVGKLFDDKIFSIQAIKNQVEAKPYGTI